MSCRFSSLALLARIDHCLHSLFSEYYAALLRTRQSFVAPTQGKLLNYVHRVPLGVVAQITVGRSRDRCKLVPSNTYTT